MKTTLKVLNGKIAALADIEKEVDEKRESFKTSEVKREELQVFITETSEKLRVDTSDHEAKHTRNEDEIKKLKEDI